MLNVTVISLLFLSSIFFSFSFCSSRLLHGGLLRRTRATKLEILSMPFMKKYLEFTRNEIQPVLTIEAAEYIGRQYAEMRNKDGKVRERI